MIRQVWKRPVRTIIEFPQKDDAPPEHALLVGSFQDGRPLLVRNWANEDDVHTRLSGDESFFAPSVRKVRLTNYRAHKARAQNPITAMFQPTSPYYGKTWLLVGSGPSTEIQLDALKDIKRDYPDVVVVAINDAMRCLGPINVHGFIALCWLSDTKWWSGLGLKDVDLFTSFYTPIGILEPFLPERTYHFSTPLRDRMTPYAQADIEKFGALDAGLPVSYSALHMAFRCHAKKIILVGQDLAYTDCKSHAFERLPWAVAEHRECIAVKDINGNMTVTDQRMMRHAKLLAGGAFWCERSGIPVYNSSGAGILNLGYGRTIPLLDALQSKEEHHAMPRLETLRAKAVAKKEEVAC